MFNQTMHILELLVPTWSCPANSTWLASAFLPCDRSGLKMGPEQKSWACVKVATCDKGQRENLTNKSTKKFCHPQPKWIFDTIFSGNVIGYHFLAFKRCQLVTTVVACAHAAQPNSKAL